MVGIARIFFYTYIYFAYLICHQDPKQTLDLFRDVFLNGGLIWTKAWTILKRLEIRPA